MTDLDNVIIEQLYIYFGGPAPRNFQMILEGGFFITQMNQLHGALFFRPFLWFAVCRDEVLADGTFKGLNNGTALMNYYIDIGVLGLLLFPLFWGAVTGFFYGYFRCLLHYFLELFMHY